MGISIVVDVWRSRRLQRIADKYDSQALQADALAFQHRHLVEQRGDSWLVLVLAGARTRSMAGQGRSIAALVVACIVVYVSWRLARQTIDALLDGAPAGVRDQLSVGCHGSMECWRSIVSAFGEAGNKYFADVSVAMSRNVTFQKSEQVANEVVSEITRTLAGG